MREALLLSLLLLPACEPDKPTETGGDTGGAGPLCADGTWGSVSDPADALFVTADGDDAGDGSRESPLLTLDAAVAASRASGAPKRIAVGDGDFAAALTLADDLGDTDLRLEGCGPGATTLVGGEDEPALALVGITGFQGAGFTIEGGRRGVVITQAGDPSLTDVTITGALRAGILMDGSYGLLDVTLTGVTVEDVRADDSSGTEAYGYGVAVQGDAMFGVTLTMTGSTVSEATHAAVLVSGSEAAVTLSDVTIAGTRTHTGGTVARGVQVQSDAVLDASDLVITGGTDAGVYAYEPGGITLTRVSISGVAAGVDADGLATGDGVVVTQDPANNFPPTSYPFALDTVTVTGAPRAGVLLAGVAGTAADITASDIWTGSPDGTTTWADEGYTDPIVTQAAADVTVTGVGEVQELADELALASLVTPLATDDDLPSE